jgi:hypothetical protein
VRKFVALALVQSGLLAACGGGGGYSGGGTPPPPPGVVCTNANASLTQQLQNPVTLFAPPDNNGVIVELPTIGTAGQAMVTGALVFGIGTQTNNGLGTATVLPEDPLTGFVSATYKSTTYTHGYLDSGSNGNFFTDTFMSCPSPDQAWYCPSSTMSETATLQGQGTATATAGFSVSNAQATFNANPTFTAFADLGGATSDAQAFDLGLPFHFGRNVFTAIEARVTPGGPTGPYLAFSAPMPPAGPGPNVETLTVGAGPADLASHAINTAFVSVKVCAPGTSTCQTIDNIEVDTGSTGLRLMSSKLTVTLPAEKDASGYPLAECLKFADGTSWGSVAVADIQLPVSGKTASNVNVHIIGDPTYKTPPSDCSGTPENTVAAFGANGILGVGPFAQDCGSACVAPATPIPATYYSCH